MGKITVQPTPINGLLVIQPTVYGDERGYFFECYSRDAYVEAGIELDFVQDNQSLSAKGVLRGLHLQKQFPQGKLVRVLQGAVWDVAVDIRPDSSTYGQWYGIELSAENNTQFYIPPRFAHGFVTLSEKAVFSYKCTDYYHPEDEAGIIYNDPEIAIQWPVDLAEVTLSEKDKNWGSISDLQKK